MGQRVLTSPDITELTILERVSCCCHSGPHCHFDLLLLLLLLLRPELARSANCCSSRSTPARDVVAAASPLVVESSRSRGESTALAGSCKLAVGIVDAGGGAWGVGCLDTTEAKEAAEDRVELDLVLCRYGRCNLHDGNVPPKPTSNLGDTGGSGFGLLGKTTMLARPRNIDCIPSRTLSSVESRDPGSVTGNMGLLVGKNNDVLRVSWHTEDMAVESLELGGPDGPKTEP